MNQKFRVVFLLHIHLIDTGGLLVVNILYKSYRPHKVATEIIFKFTEDAIAPIKMTWQRGEETLLKSEVEK